MGAEKMTFEDRLEYISKNKSWYLVPLMWVVVYKETNRGRSSMGKKIRGKLYQKEKSYS